MKNFLITGVFFSAVTLGFWVSQPFQLSGTFENYLHEDCVRWSDETLEKPLFTLSEAKGLLGRNIAPKQENFRKTGKIIHLEMVGQDKFLVAVYWETGFDDKNAALTFIDKEWFTRDFEIID